jgi:hypothetical protein
VTSAVDTPPGVSLSVPAEPVELRATVRDAVLGGADWAATFGDDLGVGDYLWEQWGPVLGAAGLERASFTAVVSSYRRELWFWLLGDRIWAQTASGLAGRLLRRLPSD